MSSGLRDLFIIVQVSPHATFHWSVEGNLLLIKYMECAEGWRFQLSIIHFYYLHFELVVRHNIQFVSWGPIPQQCYYATFACFIIFSVQKILWKVSELPRKLSTNYTLPRKRGSRFRERASRSSHGAWPSLVSFPHTSIIHCTTVRYQIWGDFGNNVKTVCLNFQFYINQGRDRIIFTLSLSR